MIEVEVKLAVEDLDEIEARLKKLGARFAEEKKQSDTYFNAPDRDFAKTDEALRIRMENEKNFLTYKGPKIDSKTKSRREIEIEIRKKEAEKLRSMLTQLGYREVAAVNKTRKVFRLHGHKISLDRVEHLGSFVEVEATAGEKNFEARRRQVFDLLKKLGLDRAKSIRQSYLELLLARRGGEG